MGGITLPGDQRFGSIFDERITIREPVIFAGSLVITGIILKLRICVSHGSLHRSDWLRAGILRLRALPAQTANQAFSETTSPHFRYRFGIVFR